MPVFSFNSLLPNFLPAKPSIFSQTLCERAWSESSEARASMQKPEIAVSETLEANVGAVVQLYASLFRVAQEQQRLANIYADRLMRWGVWEEYSRTPYLPIESSRTSFPMSLEQAMIPLRGIVAAFPAIEPMLRIGKVPDNIVFRSAWHFFCFRYAHRALYDGELALPRFAEDPKSTFAHILALTPIRKYDDEFPLLPKLSIKARLLGMVWQKYTATQYEIELQRSETMKRVYPLRRMLLSAAETLVQKGRLPSLTHIWNLPVQDCIEF